MIQKGDWIASKVTGNMDIGVAARPIEFFSVGFVGKNILPIKEQADIPTTLALGLRGGKEDLFEGAVDVTYKTEQAITSPWAVRAGVEGSIKVVKLRGGYDWNGDRLDPHRISWGFGLFTKVGSIDYAMQIPVGAKDFAFNQVQHTVSLTIRTNFGDKNAEDAPIEWKDSPARLR
jgi:hypothetical protein